MSARKIPGATLLALMVILPAGARSTATLESLVQSAEMSASSGNYKTSADFYTKALKKRKDDPMIWQGRANAELQMKQPKKTISDINKAARLAPSDPTNYQLRARAFEALGQYKAEKEDLTKLVTMAPMTQLGTNFLWRAHIDAQLKDMKAAVADCNQAITLNLQRDQLADLYKLRAQAYKKLGKKKEAEMELAKYQSLSGSSI